MVKKLSRKEKKLWKKNHSHIYLLTKTGNPVPLGNDSRSFRKWGRMFQLTPARVVGKTVVRNLRVSTVFLGLNHQYRPGGPPLIFETMVFGTRDEPQWRYSTLKQAKKGHAAAVRYAEGLPHLVKREAA